jgi:hypothetical protein
VTAVTPEEIALAETLQREAWDEDERAAVAASDPWPDDLLAELAAAAQERRRTNAQRGFASGARSCSTSPRDCR